MDRLVGVRIQLLGGARRRQRRGGRHLGVGNRKTRDRQPSA
jgi:chloramphenicol 3-O-phosphotransferase